MVKKRSEIDVKYKWNEWNVYENDEAWNADFLTLDKLLEDVVELKGKLHESADTLIRLFELDEVLNRKLTKLKGHADVHFAQNTRDSVAQGLRSKIDDYTAAASSKRSFINTEIVSFSQEKLKQYRDFPALQPYLYLLDEIVRFRTHTLSSAEEALLSALAPALGSSARTYEKLANADIKFPEVKDNEGKTVRLTEGLYFTLRESFNRDVRKGAWEAFFGTYIGFKNTLCSTLDGHIKKELFEMRVRRYSSCLEHSLFRNGVPEAVYHTLIDAVHRCLPTFHHYLALRQRTLGLPSLDMYDMYVPLVADYDLKVPYDQAVEWILEALAPLGEKYVAIAKKGLTEERWADVYECEGKLGGGFSMETYDGIPYFYLSYDDTLSSVFMLAHELGHSMRAYYTNHAQPYRYYHTLGVVDEVFSTCNEALLFRYLLRKAQAKRDVQFELYLVNQHCHDLKSSLIRQAQFAEFERDIHTAAENGEPLTPDFLSNTYKRINDVYYHDTALASSSSSLPSSSSTSSTTTTTSTSTTSSSSSSSSASLVLTASPQIAYEFLYIPHFYLNFYVYCYATSMAAAEVLAEGLYGAYHADPHGAVYKRLIGKYEDFLKVGASKPPLEILRDVGVDLCASHTYVDALASFAGWVRELDRLLLLGTEREKEKGEEK